MPDNNGLFGTYSPLGSQIAGNPVGSEQLYPQAVSAGQSPPEATWLDTIVKHYHDLQQTTPETMSGKFLRGVALAVPQAMGDAQDLMDGSVPLHTVNPDTGEVNLNPAYLAKAFNVAATTGGTASIANAAMGPADSTLGVFVGQGAKGVDLAKLETAKNYAKLGLDPSRIADQTGWWKGADGQWKTEISDVGAKLGPGVSIQTPPGSKNPVASIATGSLPLGRVLDHPELFKAYPDLFGMEVNKLQGQTGLLGFYQPGSTVPGSAYMGVAAQKPSDFMQTLLHEVQHAIQQKEGFANGGAGNNPDYSRLAGEVEANTVMRRWQNASNSQQVMARLAAGRSGPNAFIDSQLVTDPISGKITPLWFDKQVVTPPFPTTNWRKTE